MYINHPKDSEFFDINDFVDSNIEFLDRLYDDLEVLMGTPETDEDTQDMGVMMGLAVCDRRVNIEKEDLPISLHKEDEKLVETIAGPLVVLCHMFTLERKGLLERNGENFSLTEEARNTLEQENDA